MQASGSDQFHRVHLEQLLERADADLLNPTEQLAAAVADALDHQKLLRCEQQAAANLRRHAGLCSVFHTPAPVFPPRERSCGRPILRSA
jgi:hypothetical protein